MLRPPSVLKSQGSAIVLLTISALAIAGLRVRDIMGYCVMTFLLVTLLASVILLTLA